VIQLFLRTCVPEHATVVRTFAGPLHRAHLGPRTRDGGPQEERRVSVPPIRRRGAHRRDPRVPRRTNR